jgi:hypothetical protein
MEFIVNILIIISQVMNVIIGGDCDEMFCAKAWRYKNKSKFWYYSSYIVDNYVWPLSIWHYEGMTHCESCFWAEQKRLQERINEYAQFIAEGNSDEKA